MALRWSWSFSNESTADLTAMAWTPSGGGLTLTSAADKVYSYTGSPTRYGWIFDGAFGSLVLPASVGAGVTNGWLAAPIKAAVASGFNADPILRVTGTSGAHIDARVTSAGALSLYVSSVFKETTAAIDWLSWRYVALRFDFSADPWTGQIWIDGAAATSLATETDAPDTVGDFRIQAPARFGTSDGYISQVVVWDSVSDSGEEAQYVTRVDATADGTNVGTWTPSTGTDDYAVVGSPFNAATYTEEAAPSALDRVEVVTPTLSTALGVTPSSVAAVTAHTYSEGQAITARAVVGDGGAGETSGTTTAISPTTTTYAYATATTAPTSAAAWTGTDAVDLVYEVVTV